MAVKLISDIKQKSLKLNSDTAFQCFPKERYSFKPVPVLSLPLIICVYSHFYAYLISFEISCSDRGCDLVFFSSALNRWGFELQSSEKNKSSQAFVQIEVTEPFLGPSQPLWFALHQCSCKFIHRKLCLKIQVLLREMKTCTSPGIPIKMFGLTCAMTGLVFFFFGGLTVTQAQKHPIFWELAYEPLKTANVL